ncbi:MAG: hypothetical protein J6X98_05815 [Bacteroidales bacterium]|nr:hypothetical protein [Bacteroidales bacterium]
MKKNYLKIGIVISALLMLATTQSCREESLQKQRIGYLIPKKTNEKTGNQYVLFCLLGHDGSRCPGCLLINGKWTHVDCQGVGSACNKVTNVALSYNVDNDLIATTLDTIGLTELDYINMPAESFALEIDPGVYSYLNIPAQLVYRDNTTKQFTFTGLSFSDRPLY